MAEVYLACSGGIEGFKKRVVIKRVLPQYSVNTEFVQMFLNEARLTAMLDHPNIVQVHDMGEEAGSYYLSMEYVRGQDVRNIVVRACSRQERVPLSCVVSIGLGVAAGLHHAHEATDHEGNALGIIHRDVSLSNVLVSYDGTVKVVDFGIAKAAASNTETRTGTLKGKISYMSPEQCCGDPLDRRSDVFSIGIVLYELVTGSRLFAGDNDFKTLQRIAREDVEAPSTRRPEIPPELDAIILRALDRDRDKRYQTALELQRDLHRFARSHGLSASSFELADYMSESFSEAIAAEPSDSQLRHFLALAARRDDDDEGEEPSIQILVDQPDGIFAEGSGEQPAIAQGEERLTPRWMPRALLGLAGVLVAAAAIMIFASKNPVPSVASPQLQRQEPTALVPVPVLAVGGPVETPPEQVVSPIPEPAAAIVLSEPKVTPEVAKAPAQTLRSKRRRRRQAKRNRAKRKQAVAPRPAKPKNWDTRSALLPKL